MKKGTFVFMFFGLLLLSGEISAQIKVHNLPTTTTGIKGDYLIKDDSVGTAGSTKKIAVRDFLSTYGAGGATGPTGATGATGATGPTGATGATGSGSSFPMADSSWSKLGNSGTSPASNFLGTTDNKGLSFRTNNKIWMHLDSIGGLKLMQGYDTLLAVITDPLAPLRTNNICIGDSAGASIPLSIYDSLTSMVNIFMGRGAGAHCIHGYGNLAIGNYAMYLSDGTWNTSTHSQIGSNSENSAIGNYSLLHNTTGYNNTCLGAGSGYSNTTGAYNTFIGWLAGHGFLTGSSTQGFNTYVGERAGYGNTGGVSNTFVGSDAGFAVEGDWNSFLGDGAYWTATTGNRNSGIGVFAMGNSGNGTQYCVALGVESGYNNGGSENVYVGSFAGFHNTSMSNRLFIDGSTFATTLDDDTSAMGLIYGGWSGHSYLTNFLKVDGTIAMHNGTEALGKILTCVNANGYSIWNGNVDSTLAGDAITINETVGSFVKDSTGTTFTLTDSYITSTSKIFFSKGTTGVNISEITAIPTSGSATITFEIGGIATAPNKHFTVNFEIRN